MIVEKVWGREEWLIQEPEYWAKRLYIKPKFRCSLHYHVRKKETFLVESGWIVLEHGGTQSILGPGQFRTILPLEPHRFWAHNGGDEERVILEVSTFHSDDDVVRLEPSGAI